MSNTNRKLTSDQIQKRLKQISIGLDHPDYTFIKQHVPLWVHPSLPVANNPSQSKRSFAGSVTAWKKKYHMLVNEVMKRGGPGIMRSKRNWQLIKEATRKRYEDARMAALALRAARLNEFPPLSL